MSDITEHEDVLSVQGLLTASECQELYQKNPILLEIREFVVKYSLKESTEVSEPTSPTRQRPPRPAPPIPRASLRAIANSLLEENRYEGAVRFLTSVGVNLLIQDAKTVAGLLAIFKPTHLIEKDLEKRSQYLLQNMGIANVDYSKAWKVDNQRRRGISQSQQRILTCLASANVQFVKPWFEDAFANEPDRFWAYLGELTALPGSSAGPASEEAQLELELYQNRLNLACILLEQMCADLADNMATLHKSMFLKVVSDGSSSLSRIAYPTQLLSVVFQRFQAISFRRCPFEESKLVRLLLDMTAISAICDALALNNCVETLVGYLDKEGDAKSFSKFLDLLSSDSMALEMVNHAFMSYFRVAGLPGENWSQKRANSFRQPLSTKKTAFYLRHLRPQSRKEDPESWYEVVSLLGKFVQRAVSAYCRRMCHVNCMPQASTAGLDSDFPHTLLVASARSDTADIAAAYQSLRTYLEDKLPQPSAADALTDTDEMMDCSSDGSSTESDGSSSSKPGPTNAALLNKIYLDLDLIGALVNFAVGGE
ncbi:hypothetical protein GGI18_000329 [Coemansia linderi]|uniref:Uncharacterized protein n=1 Tax=Coemansia linderi TaxID=2663919 RepID=A0ACC1KPM8_9FUNG|nr:hypothetical protein GGI18_000329 [Coemansia linderi]